jgi:hypothetical protein
MSRTVRLAFSPQDVIVFTVALSFALLLNGAVPFVALPTLGQAVWTTGFSQSFVNESLLSLHATNFGVPEPAAISFGLAGAYPAGLFIAAGLHPADAYAAMAALWLTVAFVGAWRVGLMYGSRSTVAAVAALLWMSMPIIWGHADYSMLSFGIALLPFYFWTALRLIARSPGSWAESIGSAALYSSACLIAVFMDGYSFMMFAAGASLLGAYALWRHKELRRHLLVFALPVHVVGFTLAYALYAAYIGKAQFAPAPLDFFRGWGVDLTFLLVPTQGVHWLWDALGLSIPRSDKLFFGDLSVWSTTFSAPVIIAGLVAWWLTRNRVRFATGFLIVALFGLYMALGPSLKIGSTRPAAMVEGGTFIATMPAEVAVATTGSALISGNVPGFRNMRAAYRWLALSLCGFWLLLVALLGRTRQRTTRAWGATVVMLLMVSNLPHVVEKWQRDVSNREAFLNIDADLVADMSNTLQQGELVAFLPYGNDFLANYLAARLKIKTYNIGGDKNLVMASQHWPQTMRRFQMGQANANFTDKVLLLLAGGGADAVVLPYIDMLGAAHFWPPQITHKKLMEPVIAELRASKFVTIDGRQYYALVRIAPRLRADLNSGELERLIARPLCLVPACLSMGGAELAHLPTQVGRFEVKSLYSDGGGGFLVYGPYLPMNAGEYRLVVSGVATRADSAWVDVVSSNGEVQHARFPISVTSTGADGVLATGRVTLNVPVDDLEVRIYAGTDDKVRLDGYRLEPVERTGIPTVPNSGTTSHRELVRPR